MTAATSRLAIITTFALATSGCCAFMPCHPALSVHGRVTEAGTNRPLADATLAVFGARFRSTDDGCLKFGLADGLPFTLAVTRPGFKALTAEPPRGYFELAIELAPEGSAEVGVIRWKESSPERFAQAPACH